MMKSTRLLTLLGIFLTVVFSVFWILKPSEISFPNLEIKSLSKTTIDTTNAEQVEIEFNLTNSAAIVFEIITMDGDLIYSEDLGNLESGSHSVLWSGKDDSGLTVPNEAYLPQFRISSQGHEQLVSNYGKDGGEELKNISRHISTDKIALDLPQAGRVLIRAGVSGGALLRTIKSWTPMPAGSNQVSWNGQDQSNLINISSNKDLKYLILAFALPENSIITYGNDKLEYREYRRAKGWPFELTVPNNIELERDGQPLLQNSFYPVYRNMTPRIEMSINGSTDTLKVSLNEPLNFEIKIHPDDEWAMDQSVYEIGFFMNGYFVSEEEQGFSPFEWRVTPSALGLNLGENLITVNITGFGGEVGVVSQKIIVEDKHLL